ncbi:MAG: hypothetical protein J1E62_00470 [Lachnospiraceae bacterium]|nr:hypothetical protein [Lachnospiraceae bacterium]
MAIHFSEEEQEKLEKDDAAIYQKHSDEAIEEERKNLTFSGKLKQFRDYYLKGVIVGIIVLAMVVLQIRDTVTKEKIMLFITIQGDVIDDKVKDALEDCLNDYLGLEKGKETVRISLDSDVQQIQTYLYTGTTDIHIASAEDFNKWASSSYFFAANGNEEVDFYNDYPEEYHVYSQFISGEDVRNNTEDTNIIPSDKTLYYTGVSLKDSEKYKQIGGMLTDPVVGINYETKHLDEASAVVKYFMDNSLKMDLDVEDVQETGQQ